MKFYAYLPTKEGNEPMGSADRMLFELKTIGGGIGKAIKRLGKHCRVFTYTKFYDDNSFRQIYEIRNRG